MAFYNPNHDPFSNESDLYPPDEHDIDVDSDDDGYSNYPVHVGDVDEATAHADLGGLEMDLHEDVDLSVHHADDATEDEEEEEEEEDCEDDEEDEEEEDEDEYEEEEEADALMNYMMHCPDLSISQSHINNTTAAGSTSAINTGMGGIHALKSWKTRDPIYAILSQRRRLQDTFLTSCQNNNNHNFSIRHPYGKIQNEKGSGRGRGRKKKGSTSTADQALTGLAFDSIIPKGKEFNIEHHLSNAIEDFDERNKPQMVRQAFDAAAFAVLRAILLNKKTQAQAQAHTIPTVVTGSSPALFLKSLDELDEAKMISLGIVSGKHKLDTKNTDAGGNKSNTNESSSSSSGKKTTASSAGSKRSVKSISNSNSGGGNNSGGGTGGAAALNHSKTSSSTSTSTAMGNSQDGPSEGTDSVPAPAVQLAGYSNLDSRSTISRAILCAAASLTFKRLTPNFEFSESSDSDSRDRALSLKLEYHDDSDSEEEEMREREKKKKELEKDMDVNPVNIPQNPQSYSSNVADEEAGDLDNTMKGKIKSEESANSKDDDEDDNDENQIGGQNSNSDNPSNANNGTNAVSSSTSGKQDINMGAVIMAAEIFAKRTIEQARGAAERGDQRRKWRRDCAKAEVLVKRHRICGNGHGHGRSIHSKNGKVATRVNPLEHYLAWKSTNNVVTEDEDSHVRDRAHDREEDAETEDEDDHHHNRDQWSGAFGAFGSFGDDDDEASSTFMKRARSVSLTQTSDEEWIERCLPRLLNVINHGPGHAIYHDLQWESRADRILQLLNSLATSRYHESKSDTGNSDVVKVEQVEGATFNGTTSTSDANGCDGPNFGPHLIITTEHDLDLFMDLLSPLDYCGGNNEDKKNLFLLRGLKYDGNTSKRRQVRLEHFTSLGLSGLSSTPYNVVVTSYKTFIQDYLHFCQISFQAVVLDDGMSWLGTAHFDPNGQLGKVYDKVWSKSDMHAGLAGVKSSQWDFSFDVGPDGKFLPKKKTSAEKGTNIKPDIDETNNMDLARSSVGLTARHRILVASQMHSIYRDSIYPAPAPALLSFLIPQFSDVVKEEWDRSRVHTCEKSMDHVRKLISRGVVVYTGSENFNSTNLFSLAMAAMTNDERHGTLGDRSPYKSYQFTSVTTDKMISDGKIVQSRRLATSWLTSGSPIRQELGSISLSPVMNITGKALSSNGYICEEVVTASSVANNGAGCVVVGASAYKTAVRCGRRFGNEQSLRQHIAAMHAPPGTWLCRSCAIDCGTSQARTQHERSCAANASGNATKDNSMGGGIPTVGQCSKKKSGVKKSSNVSDKDKDGCYRVPGYRGVWVDPKGKHFIKVNNKAFTQNIKDGSGCDFYESSEEAARTYDDIVREKGLEGSLEMNYKPDGSRIKYDDQAASSGVGRGLEMLGGGASSVVPALSVINIKDLPKGVVPLLRDPRQTSRAGGNSKRYIYAYRGVCRQARKGHDRWQSQISFGGTNHYLGTFDSEYDAAAIYAWAHLILYGEEATMKAKKEGEDAVAAFEQEKKDIADGKIVAPPQKKKRPNPAKPRGTGQRGRKKKSVEQQELMDDGIISPLTADIVKIAIPKMSSEFQGSRLPQDENELMPAVSQRILACRSKVECSYLRCISIGMTSDEIPAGCALLVGLSPNKFNWDAHDFISSLSHLVDNEGELFLESMENECRLNERFRSLMQGAPCFIGKASVAVEQAAVALGFYGSELGGTIGEVDCNIGGIGGSCSVTAACISYSPGKKLFQLTACGKNDIITLNGGRINIAMGSLTIYSGDVVSVGSRVFLFLCPSN